MIKRMKSADGGFTHAYSEGDVEYLKKLGWVEEKEPEKLAAAEMPVEKRGPGRPKAK
jgi:hypothetical protein